MLFLTFLFLFLLLCILGNAPLAMYYADIGLELWFRNMIPALLPFLILSGIMLRMELTEKVSMLLYPLTAPCFRVRKNVVYAMLLGFLCGFPMGAKVTAELYANGKISRREASYLLAFCNNIGPVYFCSFVLPLLERSLRAPYLFGMYGIPLLYGLVLRYTLFRDLEAPALNGASATERRQKPVKPSWKTLLRAVDESVRRSLQSILTLGGYMILFNLLNLVPHIFLGHSFAIAAPLLEITGGLSMLGSKLPLYSLLTLSFGGLSCAAQTYSCICDTDLSFSDYLCHKAVLTALCGAFYLCWFLLLPSSFLR